MSTYGLFVRPRSALYAGDGALTYPEAGGYLPLGAGRPLHRRSHSRVNTAMPANVMAVFHLLKMSRVHARRLLAAMMNVVARRYRAIDFLKESSVSLFTTDHRVSTVESPRPDPANRRETALLFPESGLSLPRVMSSDVVKGLSFDVSGGLPIDRRQGCFLSTAALAQAGRVLYATPHGPTSVTALKEGGCH